MKKIEKQTIIVGDFNLPDINWSDMVSTSRGRPVLDAATEENLEQMVHFPTRIKGNTLDLILTNCPDKIISVLDGGRIGKSDHQVINIEVKVKRHKKTDSVTRANWNKADITGLKSFLSRINWRNKLTHISVDEAWPIFKSTIDEAIVKFVPSSTVRSANTPKWLTREIVRLVRKKKRVWKLAMTHSTMENLNKYKTIEKEVGNCQDTEREAKH